MEQALHHGGNLAAARQRFPDIADWLDLSTGINPWPYPVPQIDAAAWARLPDRDLLEALEARASGFYGTPGQDNVVAAPGTQSLIQTLPLLRQHSRVAVIGFTYQEHAHCWRRAGHSVDQVASLDEAYGADVIVLVNPNNPDGRILPRARLLRAAAEQSARGGWIVVDEAFAETAPGCSIAAESACSGVIILRSFGKFFGLAGVRLGFALTSPEIRQRVAAALGPWAVSGPAAVIASQALADADWVEEARDRLTSAAAELQHILLEAGLRVIGGTPLFTLVETGGATALHEHLLRCGILVRRFPDRAEWLRFGLPPDEVAQGRLAAALRSFG